MYSFTRHNVMGLCFRVALDGLMKPNTSDQLFDSGSSLTTLYARIMMIKSCHFRVSIITTKLLVVKGSKSCLKTSLPRNEGTCISYGKVISFVMVFSCRMKTKSDYREYNVIKLGCSTRTSNRPHAIPYFVKVSWDWNEAICFIGSFSAEMLWLAKVGKVAHIQMGDDAWKYWIRTWDSSVSYRLTKAVLLVSKLKTNANCYVWVKW